MISAWRIDKATRSRESSFSGEGAALAGGRWNHPGARIVYAAEALSLAALEKFIHLGDEGRALKLVSYRIEIPSSVAIEEIKLKGLPDDWLSAPAPRATMDIGTRWARGAHTVVLKVPSAVIEGEYNYLLNPLHPDFKILKISTAQPFEFDARMWRP